MASTFMVKTTLVQFLPVDNQGTVYYIQSDESETKFAKELHERLRREFPEARDAFSPGTCHLTVPAFLTAAAASD